MSLIALFTRGDARFGSGHLHRTCWLREVLLGQQRKGLGVEVYCQSSPLAEIFWEQHGVDVAYADDPLASFLDAQSAAAATAGDRLVCVLDWLDSTPEQVQALRAAGAQVVLLDDYGPAQAEADLTINCLLAPLAAEDQQLGRSRLLSGAPFLQLPPRVTKLRGIGIALQKQLSASRSGGEGLPDTGRAPGPVLSIVLSFGGAPRLAQTRLALAALEAAGYRGSVTVMPAPLELDQLPQPAAETGMSVRYLPADDSFHDLLAGADLALLAGGLSLYEAAFLGIPAVVLPVVHHQTLTARKLARAGCCLLAEGWELLDEAADLHAAPLPQAVAGLAGQLGVLLEDAAARGRMSAAGQQLCDGRGLLRTAELVVDLVS